MCKVRDANAAVVGGTSEMTGGEGKCTRKMKEEEESEKENGGRGWGRRRDKGSIQRDFLQSTKNFLCYLQIQGTGSIMPSSSPGFLQI